MTTGLTGVSRTRVPTVSNNIPVPGIIHRSVRRKEISRGALVLQTFFPNSQKHGENRTLTENF